MRALTSFLALLLALCACASCGGGDSVEPAPPPSAGRPPLPADHLFNTPIDQLPVHAGSAAFLATIGTHHLHLDLGQSTDMASDEYWGIPYNVVRGGALTWTAVRYQSGGAHVGRGA